MAEIRNFKQYVEDIRNLHDDITSGNIEGAMIFLEKYPEEAYVYLKQESAAAAALKAGNVEIYGLLISSGKLLGPDEFISGLLSSSNDGDGEIRKTIRDLHIKHAKSPFERHVELLRLKCRLSTKSREKDRGKFNGIILTTLEALNSIELIKPLVKFAAYSEPLTIFFDFDHDTVEQLNPTKKNGIRGTTMAAKGLIFVGARDLKDDEACHEAYGVLAHELCHYFMQIFYKNNGKPYSEHDMERENNFSAIVRSCGKVKKLEEIVELAFKSDYAMDRIHAELIARVPHLLALYDQNDAQLNACKDVFKELFKYFEQNVFPDINRELPAMEARSKLREFLCGAENNFENSELALTCNGIMELDLDLDASDGFINILSNCVQLTMLAIHETVKFKGFLHSFIFTKTTDLDNKNILELIDVDSKLEAKLTLVVDCDGIENEKLTKVYAKLQKMNLTKSLIFVTSMNFTCELSNVHVCCAIHEWSQLTEESKTKLMAKPITFQGKTILLEDLLDGNLEAINFIPLKSLIDEDLKISSGLDFKDSHYGRKFLILKPNIERSSSGLRNWVRKRISKRGRLNNLFGTEEEHHQNQRYPDKINDSPTTQVTNQIEHLNISKNIFDRTNEFNYEDVIEISEREKFLLLADAPGMGRTTELKFIASVLKEKYPARWILYWDLKKYVDFYFHDELNPQWDDEAVAEFLGRKILNLDDFERMVFAELFMTDRVVLLMDGLDEVSLPSSIFLIHLLIFIKNKTKNIILLSTSPHLIKDIHESLRVKDTYQLKLLSSLDERLFIETLLRSKGCDINQSLPLVNEILMEIKKRSEYRIINPMLLKMAVEFIAGSLSNILSMNRCINLYAIYKEFTDQNILRFINESNENGDDDSSFLSKFKNIVAIHQKQAFIAIDRHNFLDKYFTCILSLCLKGIPKITPETAADIGLMYQVHDSFTFTHKSIAEFFVADFIFQNLFKKWEPYNLDIHKNILGFLLTLTTDINCKMVFVFLNDAVELLELDKNKKKLKLIHKEMLKSFQKIKKDKDCLNLLENFKVTCLEVFSTDKNYKEFWKDFRERLLIAPAN